MPPVYPIASSAKVTEALAAIEAERMGQSEVPIYKQILIAVATAGQTQAPSVKPVLFTDADIGSYTVNLNWTASNRSAQYKVFVSDDNISFTQVATVSGLFYTYEAPETPATLYFYVTPFNLIGEGPSSDTVDQVVPGEPEAGSLYLRPDSVSLYFRPDGVSLYIRPA